MLLWYFDTLSQISTVYGSLTTAIAVLLSLEVAATLLLLGAQVIAEYERIGRQDAQRPPRRFHTRPTLTRPQAANRPAWRAASSSSVASVDSCWSTSDDGGALARALHISRPLATSVSDAVAA